MFLYPTQFYPRRSIEQIFGVFYLLNVVAAVCGFVVTFSDFYDRQSNSYNQFFGSNILFQFSAPLQSVLRNCTFTGEITIAGLKGTSTVDQSSAPAFLMVAGVLIMGMLIVHLIFIVTAVLMFVCFDGNIATIRIGGATFPIQTWNISSNVASCVAITCLVWTSQGFLDFGHDYIQYCSNMYMTTNLADYIDAEYDTKVIFGTNLYWLFATAMASLGILFIGVLFHLREAMRRGYVLLALGQKPWTKNFLGIPDKNVLRWWCRRRAVLLGTLEETLSADVVTVNPFPTYTIAPDYSILEEDERADMERLSKEQSSVALAPYGGTLVSPRRGSATAAGPTRSPLLRNNSFQPPLHPYAGGPAVSPSTLSYWRNAPQSHNNNNDAAYPTQDDNGFDDQGEAFDPEEEDSVPDRYYFDEATAGGQYDPAEKFARMDGGEQDDAQQADDLVPEGEDEPRKHRKRKSRKHKHHHKHRDREQEDDDEPEGTPNDAPAESQSSLKRRSHRIPPPSE